MRTTVLSRNAELDAITAQLDGGYLKFYSGTQPSDPDSPASGTLLATLRFGTPAFGDAANGISDANAITSDPSAAATGSATWARFLASDNSTTVLDVSVGTSGADLNLNSVNIQSGTEVRVTGFRLRRPLST